MVNLLREEFREVEIKGCRIHLCQAWYRKIQSLGLFVGASGIISSTKLSSVSSGGRKGSPKNWDSHLPISLDLSL
jgi:hypothetical protein